MSDGKPTPLPTPIAPEGYKRHEYSYIVHGAKVECTCGEKSTSTLVIPDRGSHTGYGAKAMNVDGTSANFASPFAKCSASPDKKCTLSPLNGTWDIEGKYTAFSQVPFAEEGGQKANAKLYPIMWKSTLVCWKGGIISIVDNGQDPSITQPDSQLDFNGILVLGGVIGCADTPVPGPADVVGVGVIVIGGIIYWASRGNPRDLEKGMSKNQKGMFQREIEEWKRQNGMRPNDNIPWEVLVMLADEIKKLFK